MGTRFAHVGVSVSDLDKAEAFFAGGLQLRRCHEGHEWTRPPFPYGTREQTRRVRFEFPCSGAEIHLVEQSRGTPIDGDHANPGTCHIAFYTDDIVKALADMEAHGAVLCSDEIVEIEGGVFDGGKAFYCAGPNGVRIELMQGPVYLDGTLRREKQQLPSRNANEATHFGVHVRDRDMSLGFWRDTLRLPSVAEWTEASAATRAVIGYPEASLHMAILRLRGTQSFCEVIEYRGTQGKPVDNSIDNPGACHFAFRTDDLEETRDMLGNAGIDLVEMDGRLACFDPDGYLIVFES